MMASEPKISLPFDLCLSDVDTFAKEKGVSFIALQFPDGLLQYSLSISSYLESAFNLECIVLGDVAYGSCCIEDEYAESLGAQALIHFGHNRLIKESSIPVLYIPCRYKQEIEQKNIPKLIESIKVQFNPEDKIALLTTAQHSQSLKPESEGDQTIERKLPHLFLPSNPPLPDGEFLGCTCPQLRPRQHINDQQINFYEQKRIINQSEELECDAIVCYVDGRFHVDAAIIASVGAVPCYRFDPGTSLLTLENIELEQYAQMRRDVNQQARNAHNVGIAFSTLGRQGNKTTLKQLSILIEKWAEQSPNDRTVTYANLSEITSDTLQSIKPLIRLSIDKDQSKESQEKSNVSIGSSSINQNKSKLYCNSNEYIQVWVVVGCPRLALDWGSSIGGQQFLILAPHEAFIAFGTENEDSHLCDKARNIDEQIVDSPENINDNMKTPNRRIARDIIDFYGQEDTVKEISNIDKPKTKVGIQDSELNTRCRSFCNSQNCNQLIKYLPPMNHWQRGGCGCPLPIIGLYDELDDK